MADFTHRGFEDFGNSRKGAGIWDQIKFKPRGLCQKGIQYFQHFQRCGFCVIWKFQGGKFQGWGFFSYKIIVLSLPVLQ